MSAPLFAVVVRRMTWDIAHCAGRSPRRFVARIARNSHFTPSGRLVLRIIFSWQSVTPDRDQFQGIPGVPVLRQMLRPIAWAESGSFWRAGQGQGDELISIALGSRSGLFTPACVRVKTDTSLFYCLCSATQSRFSARITVVSSRAQTFPASLLLFPQPSSLFSILHVQSILFVAVVLVFSHSLFFFSIPRVARTMLVHFFFPDIRTALQQKPQESRVNSDIDQQPRRCCLLVIPFCVVFFVLVNIYAVFEVTEKKYNKKSKGFSRTCTRLKQVTQNTLDANRGSLSPGP